jgi:hypothetical protein
MRTWPKRRWTVAAAAAVGTVLVVAVPTDLIDTPVFSREVPPTWWAWPVTLVAGVLSGLLLATYVADPASRPEDDAPAPARAGSLGGVLTFFAVGCPVCNKIVLLALGTTGAMRWFEPVQPVLSVAAIGLLAWALRKRLTSADTCAVATRVGPDAPGPAGRT